MVLAYFLYEYMYTLFCISCFPFVLGMLALVAMVDTPGFGASRVYVCTDIMESNCLNSQNCKGMLQ